MSNSPLATYTNLSPNCTKPRNHVIDTLTPHVVVGQVTSKWIADYFTDPKLDAAPNYGIGKDGDISLCVEECNRSWCTSSRSNDHRAITVEIASDKTEPWAITDKALSALIDLFTDICKRNGKNKVVWIDDKDKALAYNPASNEMIITVHRWFANKSCPGPYLYERLGYVRDEINKRLNADKPTEEIIYRVQVGAFSVKKYADDYLKKVKAAGFDAFIVYTNKMYKIQVGAFSVKKYADAYLEKVKKAGFDAFITKGGK